MTPSQIEEMEMDLKIERQSGFSRWGWFGFIDRLANGDPTKYEAVSELNFIMCLNTLSYWKEKEELENKLSKDRK